MISQFLYTLNEHAASVGSNLYTVWDVVYFTALHFQPNLIFSQFESDSTHLDSDNLYFFLKSFQFDCLIFVYTVAVIPFTTAQGNIVVPTGTANVANLPILMDDTACTGNELNLFHCNYNMSTGDCSHDGDARVKCFFGGQ